jgi:hypothetical protein
VPLLASPSYSPPLKGKSSLSNKGKEKKQDTKFFLLSSLFAVLVLVVIHAMLLWRGLLIAIISLTGS